MRGDGEDGTVGDLGVADVHGGGVGGDLYSVAAHRPEPDDEGGRGLLLVSVLADAWGVGERMPGKVAWCEFAASARMFAGSEPGAHHLP